MNLLELMLKEEVEWPVGAWFATQDASMKLYLYSDYPVFDSGIWCGNAIANPLRLSAKSTDLGTRIITREEFQSAGGWMQWSGGECPVDGRFLVDTKWGCDTRFECLAEKVTWLHEADNSNITAYRVIQQDPVLLAAVETEAMDKPCDPQWKSLRTKEDSAATAKQVKPSGQGNPILGMVLADLTNRALEGKEKYGEPLKAYNGRNALWDAYQEALDLTMYLRQLIQEQAE